jgi:hypothetical protein
MTDKPPSAESAASPEPLAMIERAIRLLQAEDQPSQAVAMALASIETVRDFLARKVN